jgi:hypothetical protein
MALEETNAKLRLTLPRGDENGSHHLTGDKLQ